MAAFQLIVAEVAMMLLLTISLVNYYKSPSVSWDVWLATYVSWVLGFAGTVLLPFDMAVTLAYSDDEQYKTLNSVWRAIYWSTFLLAWILLPIQMQYHMSGEFSFGRKLWEAIKANLLSYFAGFVMFLIFIIYMLATKGSAKTVHFLAFMMAMGNTYGVVLIILLMGNGLVSLPRNLWRKGDSKHELTRLYVMAISVESSFHDARFELEDCETQTQQTIESFDHPGSNRALKPLAETIKTLADEFEFAFRSNSNKFRKVKASEKEPVTEKSQLVALHARVKNAQLRVKSSERRWRNLLTEVKFLQSLLDDTLRPEETGWFGMRTNTAPRVQGSGACSAITYQFLTSYDWCRFIFRKYCFSFFCRFLSLLCAIASGLIFYCEIGMSSNAQTPIGDSIVELNKSGAGVFIVQALSFAYLFYMSLCTFWSLFKINLGWSFTLQGPHQSPSSSLLFNATYLSRLQFSLGYNFLLFLNSKQIDGTSFQFLMADMEIVPLFGSSFSVYAPIITAIVGFITFFNIYGRILKFVGIQDEDSVTVGEFCSKPSETELEEIETGKKLVAGQIRRLNDILLAESRAAAAAKDTVALLPGSPNNSNALGGDDDGDLELTGEDEENSPSSRGDMTSWGKASPATSSFYSSFKNEKTKEDPPVSLPPKATTSPKEKEESYLFGSWKSKETKAVDSANKAADKKLDDSSSNSKEYKSIASSRSNNSQESKGFSNVSNSSTSALASEPPRANDGWGAGGGWDVPATTRKGGRYG